MFSEEVKKKDMKKLAKAIINNFGIPHPEALIIFDSGTKIICYEGNRRLMIYKLLLNPSLLDDLKNRSIFEKGSQATQIESNFSVDCFVTKDREIALKYVEMKHSEGEGAINWGPFETAFFRKRRGQKDENTILTTGFYDIIRKLDMPDKIKNKVLGKGYASTLLRILCSPVAKDSLGFKIKDGKIVIIKDDFYDKLKVIVLNVSNKKTYEGMALNSRTLNTTSDIKKYLDSIDGESISRANEEIANLNGQLQQKQKPAVKPGSKIVRLPPRPVDRAHLIPKDFLPKIEHKKLYSIFWELQNGLIVEKAPNAAGVLFRVFLEITLNFYATEHNLSFKKEQSTGRITLNEKIQRVLIHLEDECEISRDNKGLKMMHRVRSRDRGILSIQELNEYIHDDDIQPKAGDLKQQWDELQEFFEIVFEQIQRNKK